MRQIKGKDNDNIWGNYRHENQRVLSCTPLWWRKQEPLDIDSYRRNGVKFDTVYQARSLWRAKTVARLSLFVVGEQRVLSNGLPYIVSWWQ